MRRTHNTILRWMGGLAAVFVPSVVIAVTIPNQFNAGEPIVSGDVNANFAAIATAMNQMQEQLNSVTTDLAEVEAGLGQLGLTCTTVQSADVEVAGGESGSVEVACDTAGILTGGGCRSGFPGGNFSYLPTAGFPNTASSASYVCRIHNTADTPRTIRAYARCCTLE